MTSDSARGFRNFFNQATDQAKGPYAYQEKLAAAPIESRLINVPTGCGKTAAAILAWLWQRNQNPMAAAGRLVYFCVDACAGGRDSRQGVRVARECGMRNLPYRGRRCVVCWSWPFQDLPLYLLQTALGTLRSLTKAWSEKYVRMSWTEYEGAWRPQLHFLGLTAAVTGTHVTSALQAELQATAGLGLSAFEKNLKMAPEKFRKYAQRHNQLHYAAALATDAAEDREGNVRTSFLQMVNGGKRQNYLPIMHKIACACSQEHLRNTLFGQWRYADPLEALSLRWDPREDRRHAYRWDDPSDAKTRASGSQLGANRLAMEAVPLFTVCRTRRRAATVAFTSDGRNLVWPIWSYALCLDVVRSLLTVVKPGGELDSVDRAHLRQLGVATVFRARRFAADKFQTASFALAEAL